ncbi:hypothetical protein ACQP04_12865 [Pseudonocardia halophobica]|uniref:hypothetical protein n=1 Tax=Pseudonocardia halophobica TaxID=29401 RepID=UPI003D910079
MSATTGVPTTPAPLNPDERKDKIGKYFVPTPDRMDRVMAIRMMQGGAVAPVLEESDLDCTPRTSGPRW